MCSPVRLPPAWLTPEQQARQERQWRLYARVMLGLYVATWLSVALVALVFAIALPWRAFA